MARKSIGPWYREAKNAWYFWHEGRQISLGVKGEGNRKEAVKAWHRLMANGLPKPKAVPLPEAKAEAVSESVAEAVSRFLADVQVKPSTHSLYSRHLDSLKASLGKMPIASLQGSGLSRWLRSLGVGSTTQAIVLRSVSVFLGWCVRHAIIGSNPAQTIAKPRSRSRGEEAVISPEDHAKLMANASSQFRLVLSMLHSTGARPGEVCKFTAENFDADAS